jgi:glycosyltransferase involved in cell wall biosynthesis
VTDPWTGLQVVCLSTIDWDFLWQGHQQIMASLARQGTRVLFVENSGVRAPRPRDAVRLLRRLRHWWRGDLSPGLREVEPGLGVLSPLLLPFPYSQLALRLNRRLLEAAIRRWLGPSGAPLLLWTFLPTPLALAMMERLHPRLCVYYCIDDLASSSRGARRIATSEEALLKAADLVFVTSRALRQRAACHAAKVSVFPFGVDFEAFEGARGSGGEAPTGLRGLAGPIVGYVGGVHRWVDQDLLARVAQRLPHLTFVLLGPVQCDVSRLQRQPNVRLLGPRPHSELPSYLRHFDVGIVPYLRCRYTDHVYPTKLNEYLAMGLPVVATEIPELVALEAEHPGLIGLASTSAGFADAVLAALASDGPAGRLRRVDVARANGWTSRIAAMREVIADELESGRHPC